MSAVTRLHLGVASFFLAGIGLLAASATLGLSQVDFATWVWLAVGSAVLVSGLVLAAAWLNRKQSVGRIWWLVAIGVALAARLLMMASDRQLSDDAYRYHWDGKVLSHGINPYSYAPDDSALSDLRVDEFDERINHPAVPTVYPPLAQLLFAAGYLMSPGQFTGLQILFLLCEALALFLLASQLRRLRGPPAWLLLMAWSPLLIWEGYLPGHLDSLGVAFVALFCLCLERRWAWRAGLILALACLIKPLGLLFVPAAALRLGMRGSLRAAGAFCVVCLLAYLPFAAAGWNLFSSTWLMASFWSYNGSLGEVLQILLPRVPARVAAACLTVGLVVLGLQLGRDWIARLQLAFCAFCVCTPTLFPWYLICLMPLLVLRPDPSLLVLAALVPLSQVVNLGYQVDGVWALPAWVPWVEYLPFYTILALSAWKGWGMFARGSPGFPKL